MWISSVSDAVAILGLLGGAGWGIWRYRKMRQGEGSLVINIVPQVYLHNESKVVDATIQIENIGQAAVTINLKLKDKGKRCVLEARNIPGDISDGIIQWDKLRDIVDPIPFLSEFESSYPEYPYEINPGDKGTEHAVFSTKYDGLVVLRVTIYDKDDNQYMEKKIIDLRKAVLSKLSNDSNTAPSF